MEKIPSTTNSFDLFTELYQNIVTGILFLMAALFAFQASKQIKAPLVAEDSTIGFTINNKQWEAA